MKKLIACLLPVLASTGWSAPPADFEARVDAVRTAAEVPGMAIAIVENGKVTLARGLRRSSEVRIRVSRTGAPAPGARSFTARGTERT